METSNLFTGSRHEWFSLLIYWKWHLGQEETCLRLEAPIKLEWLYHTGPKYLGLRKEGSGQPIRERTMTT